MKIIDMEHHYYSEEFFEIAAQNNGLPHFDPETGVLTFIDGLPMPLGPMIRDRLLSLGELRMKEMDANGLDMAVLGTSAGPELIQGEAGTALSRRCNDAVWEAMQKHPGRFLGSATLPVCDVEASCQELERCVREYGFVSWQTPLQLWGHFCGREALLAHFEKSRGAGRVRLPSSPRAC